jgi:DNA-binding transcriptional LysR family regulator
MSRNELARLSDVDSEKIRQLDGSLLLVLRELLRLQRATLVAQRLGLSQSAVSHALSRLRSLFDDPLFIRKPHGLEPTRHALALAPRIEALLLAMDDIMGRPRSFAPATTTRTFRIGAPDHATTLLAPGLVARFRAQAPTARLQFTQRLGRDAQSALLRDELDVALGRFEEPDERLFAEPLFEDHYCLVSRRSHPQLNRKLTTALYSELEHVQIAVSGDLRAPAIGHSAQTPPRRTVAAVPRFLIAFAVVARSNAVALAPTRLARRHAREFGLRLHVLPFPMAPIQVLMVRRQHADAGVSFVLEELKQVVADAAR